jgi:hypothetical protein
VHGCRNAVVTLIALLCAALFSRPAHATCSGGDAISGSYSIIIQGNLASGASESLAGTMRGDGQCGLTANFFGNIAGVPLFQAGATGTYAVTPAHTGIISVTITGRQPQTFVINRVQRHKQVVALQSDGLAQAQLVARAQEQSTFSQASLNGSYSYLCASPANQPLAILSALFNGSGGGSFSGYSYEGVGAPVAASGLADYKVNPDGSYTVTLVDNAGNVLLAGGGIDSRGANLPLATVSLNGNTDISGIAHCVGQLQVPQ